MQHKIIKAGVVQATPALFALEKSVDIVVSWINRAAKEGCEFLLFPESFIPCYPRGLNFDAKVGMRTEKSKNQWLNYWENSVEVPSVHTETIGSAVKKAGFPVALGVTERDKIGGTLYCTLLYFNHQGELAGRHRKLKPTGLERYIWGEGDGSDLKVLDTPAGRSGGLICWENYMPLARMAMYRQGVELYLAPTADARDSWLSTMQHVALEGRCFVLAANQYVTKTDYPDHYQPDIKDQPEVMSSGGSIIVAPDGQVLAGPLRNKEGLLTAELDFAVRAKSKLEFDVTGHYARPDVFQFEVKK